MMCIDGATVAASPASAPRSAAKTIRDVRGMPFPWTCRRQHSRVDLWPEDGANGPPAPRPQLFRKSESDVLDRAAAIGCRAEPCNGARSASRPAAPMFCVRELGEARVGSPAPPARSKRKWPARSPGVGSPTTDMGRSALPISSGSQPAVRLAVMDRPKRQIGRTELHPEAPRRARLHGADLAGELEVKSVRAGAAQTQDGAAKRPGGGVAPLDDLDRGRAGRLVQEQPQAPSIDSRRFDPERDDLVAASR